MQPKVSVIMPVYNASLFLREAINSILNQTYKDFEFLIINDGSTDDSLAIIKSFSDERIRIINNEVNIGIIKSRNKGLQQAIGEYIAKMDADDISLPTRLEKQVNFLDQNTNVAVLATKLSLINEEGADYGFWHEDVLTTSIEQIKKMMPVINCIGQPTIMMRADVVKPIAYNENFLHNEDWGLWLEVLSRNYAIAKIDEVLLHYRIHTNSTTVNANALGVEQKIARFKKAYLKHKRSEKIVGEVERAVRNSLIKELIIYKSKRTIASIMPGALPFFTQLYRNPKNVATDFLRAGKRIFTINLFKTIRQYNQLKQLYTEQKTVDIFFFFPYCHIGGAEKVHANIIEVFADKKPVVFITGISKKDEFLYMFKEHAPTVNIGFCVNHPFWKRRSEKMIFKLIENQEKPVVFGCNNLFFSESVLKFKPNVRVFDLMHDFRFEGENNLTHTFLHQYLRCEKRIFISRMAIEQTKLFYASKKINQSEFEKITLIQNYTFIPDSIPPKSFDKTIKILYVGRGTAEKRAHLVGYIAKKCNESNMNVEFTAIGDLEQTITPDCISYVNCTGPIFNFEEIINYYNNHHIILITSQKEGFPLAIMEGMAHGLVPVSTPVGDVPFHVNENTGFITTSLNEEIVINEITAEINRLINDKALLKKMSENAYAYAKLNFSKEKFFDAYKRTINI